MWAWPLSGIPTSAEKLSSRDLATRPVPSYPDLFLGTAPMRRISQSTRTFLAHQTARRQRRAQRELFATICARPQNVRNELLEMASRAH